MLNDKDNYLLDSYLIYQILHFAKPVLVSFFWQIFVL